MVDKISPCKFEAPATGGTEEDTYPTSADPNEDYVNSRGLVIQSDSSNDESVIVSRDSSGNLTFKDSTWTSPISLSGLFAGGFGGDCQYVESNAQSSTTSSTYQDKLTLTTGTLTGSYMLLFQCERTPATANKREFIRLYNVTNSLVCCFSDYRPSLASLWDRDVGFTFVTFNGNVKTFKVQYASQDNSTTVYIKETKMVIWRVG